MLALSHDQSLQLMELMGDLAGFNEKRYQDIIHGLTNAIAIAQSPMDKDALLAVLQLASTVWYHSAVVAQSSNQLTKSLEG